MQSNAAELIAGGIDSMRGKQDLAVLLRRSQEQLQRHAIALRLVLAKLQRT